MTGKSRASHRISRIPNWPCNRVPPPGREAEFLAPFADSLTPGTLEGYTLPASDGSVANRRNMRAAMALLADAGWQVDDGGVLRNAEGVPFEFTILIRQGARNIPAITEIYAEALNRLGMQVTITQIDSAQIYRTHQCVRFRRQRITRAACRLAPARNSGFTGALTRPKRPDRVTGWGCKSPAIDALIERLLTSTERADFVAATRALDRVLTAGRHVVPFWFTDRARIAHDAALKYPDTLPAYGDWIGFSARCLVVCGINRKTASDRHV